MVGAISYVNNTSFMTKNCILFNTLLQKIALFYST